MAPALAAGVSIRSMHEIVTPSWEAALRLCTTLDKGGFVIAWCFFNAADSYGTTKVSFCT